MVDIYFQQRYINVLVSSTYRISVEDVCSSSNQQVCYFKVTTFCSKEESRPASTLMIRNIVSFM